MYTEIIGDVLKFFIICIYIFIIFSKFFVCSQGIWSRCLCHNYMITMARGYVTAIPMSWPVTTWLRWLCHGPWLRDCDAHAMTRGYVTAMFMPWPHDCSGPWLRDCDDHAMTTWLQWPVATWLRCPYHNYPTATPVSWLHDCDARTMATRLRRPYHGYMTAMIMPWPVTTWLRWPCHGPWLHNCDAHIIITWLRYPYHDYVIAIIIKCRY